MTRVKTWDLTALINSADPAAELAERHLWLVRLMEWLRHAPSHELGATGLTGEQGRTPTPLPALRLKHLLNQIERHPDLRRRVQGVAAAFWGGIDAAALYADLGFGARRSFGSELLARMQCGVLPGTPETRDLAQLFGLLFQPQDAHWLQALDPGTLGRVMGLLGPPPQAAQAALLDGITMLVSAVHASGYAPALRHRMDPALVQSEPFRQIAPAAATLRLAVLEGRHTDALRDALYLRALLDACRQAAASVMPHLEAYGVSVNIVYDLDQLIGRTHRIEQLVNCVLTPDPGNEGLRLLLELLQAMQQQRSVRALFETHYSLLARQVAERSAETGELYITRDRQEYRAMLGKACGGGAVIACTTFAKFAVVALGMTAFWTGFWSGASYALSFVIVMLLHWTVATKQPAMTAPAMAASLPRARASSDEELEVFVDKVAQLIRSQTAGILGNVALCGPLVLLVQWLASALWGQPLVGATSAGYVLQNLTLLGPSPLFAAFTGVLLFASSLIAGWAENWFVYHRLDSAIAWNPRIVSSLGAARAKRWAAWWRGHVSGVAASVSLGMMLGLVPALAGFFGLPLDVRHITLSTGQLAAALGALGWQVLREPAFWWCVAGIACTGVLNVGVSFWLAFTVALRSRGVRVQDRARITTAIRRRLRRDPMSFVKPPSA